MSASPQLVPPSDADPDIGAPPVASAPAADPAAARLPAGAVRALALATLGFGVGSWAWALLSPLGPLLVERGTVADASLVVAVPVLVGALGRVPIGALTDRLGGPVMFAGVSLAAIVPVLLLGFVGQDSPAGLLLGGLLLGIAGTVFAIGVPYVNSWFPPARRGMATGIYGASMGGTAIAAFTTVPLVEIGGKTAPFLVAAAALAVTAVLALTIMPTAPTWRPARGGLLAGTRVAVRLGVTWEASALYALSFGGYVAFSVFLPTLLVRWYGLAPGDAALRTAGFVVAAVLLRPLGGMLSDRFTATRTLQASYLVLAASVLVMALHPPLAGIGTLAFLGAAAALGLGAGAVLALVAAVAPEGTVGAVTGVVGAAGGLGGFLPPLVLAATMSATGTYAPALVGLLVAAIAALALTVRLSRRELSGSPSRPRA